MFQWPSPALWIDGNVAPLATAPDRVCQRRHFSLRSAWRSLKRKAKITGVFPLILPARARINRPNQRMQSLHSARVWKHKPKRGPLDGENFRMLRSLHRFVVVGAERYCGGYWAMCAAGNRRPARLAGWLLPASPRAACYRPSRTNMLLLEPGGRAGSSRGSVPYNWPAWAEPLLPSPKSLRPNVCVMWCVCVYVWVHGLKSLLVQAAAASGERGSKVGLLVAVLILKQCFCFKSQQYLCSGYRVAAT